jgi:hypothetical protein
MMELQANDYRFVGGMKKVGRAARGDGCVV